VLEDPALQLDKLQVTPFIFSGRIEIFPSFMQHCFTFSYFLSTPFPSAPPTIFPVSSQEAFALAALAVGEREAAEGESSKGNESGARCGGGQATEAKGEGKGLPSSDSSAGGSFPGGVDAVGG
jgi:hypothetical protein